MDFLSIRKDKIANLVPRYPPRWGGGGAYIGGTGRRGGPEQYNQISKFKAISITISIIIKKASETEAYQSSRNLSSILY